MRWINKFNNCYSFSKNNKMYLGYKLKQVHINYINNCLSQNKTITMKKLKEYIIFYYNFLEMNYNKKYLKTKLLKNKIIKRKCC